MSRTLRQVKISTPDGYTRTWVSGQEIPLPLFGDAKLEVDSIFEAINEPPINADERG